MSNIIDGTALAKRLRQEIKENVALHIASGQQKPCLAVVLVGDDPASHVYVASKEKACHEVGIESKTTRLTKACTAIELMSVIKKLNVDSSVHGILLQLPLPPHLDASEMIGAIDPKKDIDGLTAFNQGLLTLGRPQFVPCTPLGVMELLYSIDFDLKGKLCGVIGRSQLVGLPLQRLLMMKDATVLGMHSKTKDIKSLARMCEVLVVAAGKAQLVGEDWVKAGAVVIDVGIHRKDGKLVGDVNTEKVKAVASYITPVPGGVGPMTIACLLKNCLQAARKENM